MLVVEDDPSILKLMEITLKKVCDVVLAENGKIAFQKIILKQPDLIISDNMMPEMTGFELKLELNKSNDTKNIPFMFLSSIGDSETQKKAYDLGIVDYLVKPISPIFIRDKVKNFFSTNK
ncbi:MAG: response regulator [Candidatus Sericytochromatia bacterium]